MTELTKLTIADARDKLRKKEISATELTRAFVDAIDGANAHLNAYVLPTPELALKQAAESDKRLKAGDARPLEGLPLGNKDLFCTAGVRTTACSKILDDFTPTYESTVGANLWNAGAVMLGKLNRLDRVSSTSGNLGDPLTARIGGLGHSRHKQHSDHSHAENLHSRQII